MRIPIKERDFWVSALGRLSGHPPRKGLKALLQNPAVVGQINDTGTTLYAGSPLSTAALMTF